MAYDRPDDGEIELYRLSFQLNGQRFTLNELQSRPKKQAGLLYSVQRSRQALWFELHSQGFVLSELESLLNEASSLRHPVGLRSGNSWTNLYYLDGEKCRLRKRQFVAAFESPQSGSEVRDKHEPVPNDAIG